MECVCLRTALQLNSVGSECDTAQLFAAMQRDVIKMLHWPIEDMQVHIPGRWLLYLSDEKPFQTFAQRLSLHCTVLTPGAVVRGGHALNAPFAYRYFRLLHNSLDLRVERTAKKKCNFTSWLYIISAVDWCIKTCTPKSEICATCTHSHRTCLCVSSSVCIFLCVF